MSSSTSSSEPGSLWKAAVVVVCVLAALEVTTRTLLYRVSKDISRFAEYPVLAARLGAADGARVVLVGNSATAKGVDPDRLTAGLDARGAGPAAAEVFAADESNVKEWYYLVKNVVVGGGARPNLVVINFFGRNLEDSRQPEVGRLAQHFAAYRDWPEVFRTDLPGWAERAEFAVSSSWATFASGARIKERVLGQVVPGYKPFFRRLNNAAQSLPAGPATAGPPAAPTYRALERFVGYLQLSRLRACFVAFPTRPGTDPYEVGPEAVRLIRAGGCDFVDLRAVDGLTDDLYDDGIHLKPSGRDLYSDRLAEALVPSLRRAPRSEFERP